MKPQADVGGTQFCETITVTHSNQLFNEGWPIAKTSAVSHVIPILSYPNPIPLTLWQSKWGNGKWTIDR